jgi:hypothetical protein
VSTTLYRLFAGDGRLLYVGIADDPLARFKQHRRDKFWWPRVTATSMQQFDTRVEAEAAEARAIFTENPVHNMAGADPERPDRTLADHPLLVDGIPWRCFHCNRSAFPGYLQLGEDEFHRYNRALVAWIRDNLETGSRWSGSGFGLRPDRRGDLPGSDGVGLDLLRLRQGPSVPVLVVLHGRDPRLQRYGRRGRWAPGEPLVRRHELGRVH